MTQERNIALDYLKLVMSFLVVAIHAPIFETESLFLRNVIEGIARLAVPTFFVINGYFLYSVLEGSRAGKVKYFKHVAVMYVLWMLVYIPFYYKGIFSLREILRFGVLWVFGHSHLWYISAMIISSLILLVLKNIGIRIDYKLLLFSMVLYVGGWVIHQTRFNGEIDTIFLQQLLRNFLIIGFPFMLLGYWIRQNETRCLDFIQKWGVTTGVITGIILFIEIVINYVRDPYVRPELFLSLAVLSPLLFLTFWKKVQVMSTNRFYADLSIVIYLLHMLILRIIKQIYPEMLSTSCFILTCFFTVILGYGITELNKKWKIFF